MSKRILNISSELIPYLRENPLSIQAIEVPRQMHYLDNQIRIFMPKYGLVNERRHQLHEVIRLSGMNIVVNDLDQPLIIKVASIPKDRIQVYFIDNEEYFKRKALFKNDSEELFDDNDERAIFFARGVLETVKKLNWNPDIIHVHGWMASLLPMYLRTYYADEPTFAESKIITSIYDESFEGSLNPSMIEKLRFDNIPEESLEDLENPTFENIIKNAVRHSDGVMLGSEIIDEDLEDFLDDIKKPIMDFVNPQDNADKINEFYESFTLIEK